ncbi:GLE1-like protein [Gymnopilus junonius]|uniref:mRNA export factor GLE1 n=1 Tax=Gymnopilus junonius TaxID=109634 RepID=A0A9P5NCD6_GYMJU|nr:GLE1-like protein [Gymnopilus junonius]
MGSTTRQIVPKIGQLTNDAQSIAQISQQIVEILRPSRGPPHHTAVYISLCSSLAKTIILQAETEVIAKKVSAGPLAQVAFNLLDALDTFPAIFFIKLVQRCGGWAIPIVLPKEDVTGQPWSSREEFAKISGWRKTTAGGEGLESNEDHSNRISAIMRVYFQILKIRPMNKPLDSPFRVSKYWAWFARMLNDPELLKAALAPDLIYTALDVMGLQAKDIWGQQWVKMLVLIHQGITTGYENGLLMGGDSAEGAAARTRVMVALENIVKGVQSDDSY